MSTLTSSYSNSIQHSSSAANSAIAAHNNQASGSAGSNTPIDDASKKKKVTKRRKVNHACLYCRRSHMTCDEGRPCQRCIKREIGHLCHDEPRPKAPEKQPMSSGLDMTRTFAPVTVYQPPTAQSQTTSTWPLAVPTGQFLYQPETLGNEFSVLSDFLETLDDGSFFTSPQNNLSTFMSSYTNGASTTATTTNGLTQPNFSNNTITTTTNTSAPTSSTSAPPIPTEPTASTSTDAAAQPATDTTTTPAANGTGHADDEAPPSESVLPSATKTEKFLLIAADQEPGTRDERLNRVIRSKYEAGLLKPYNYVKGYARLSRWMDRNVSQESKQQILQPLSVLRPKFRAVAQSLRDIDLVFIEEAFERLLLDYDRVFSAMGVPACLWRRTGEIYKANREFTELIGVDGYLMRDGRLCIYELMAEESAVNYWEKYGHVAFDSSQKAVLTSCVLRYKPSINPPRNTHASSNSVSGSASNAGTAGESTDNPSAPADEGTESTSPSTAAGAGNSTANGADGDDEEPEPTHTEEGFVNCCFSFTIRRDKWGIPTMIVGNFIKC